MLKFIFQFIFVSLLAINSTKANPIHSKERKLYTAANSTEAKLEFSSTVQYETSKKPQDKTLRKVIEAQLEHIVGPMSMAELTAVPKGDHQVSNIKIISQDNETLTIGYNYSGTVVIENGVNDFYNVFLPVNPSKIYKASMVGNRNPCTDEHYQTEGDFWYFWSPNRPGCKLKIGRDYNIIKAKITRILNSQKTYPEYQNLPDEKGNITIHILFGMDDPSLSRNPLTSNDINAANYRTFRNYLLSKGFLSTIWNEAQVRSIAKTQDGTTPFVETIQKNKIVYRFFFAPTGIDEDSLAFHWFYKDAIEKSSIMIYEGHSGLGGHLDLDSIEENLGTKIQFNTKRYQIFFFDSCTSYRYYNQMYFDRKVSTNDPKGTKKLDIFTNGLATTFDSMPRSSIALQTAIDKSLDFAINAIGFVSYQTLAKQIDSDNLFGINGDEDNVAPTIIK